MSLRLTAGEPPIASIELSRRRAGNLDDPEFSESDRDAALAALPEGAPSLV